MDSLLLFLWIFAAVVAYCVFIYLIRCLHGYIFILKIRQESKKMKAYMMKHPDFSKLLSSAESRGIDIQINISFYGSWGAIPEKKIILVADIDSIYNPLLEQYGLGAFAHELGHIEYDRRRKGNTCHAALQKKFQGLFCFLCFECFWEEWWAWIYGEMLLDSLNIKVDKKEYWKEALRAIPQHMPCPLLASEKCPKFEAMEKLERKIADKLAALEKNEEVK